MLKLFAVDPETERGVRDIIDLFAFYGVVAVVQLGRIVLLDHLVIACSLEADAFDLLERDVLDRVGDGEPAAASRLRASWVTASTTLPPISS